jgi:WD40 repeat protein
VAAWDFRYLSTNADDTGLSSTNQNKRLCTTVREPDGRLYLHDYARSGQVCGSVLLARGPSRHRKTVQCLGTDNIIREWDYQSGDIVSQHVTGHCDLVSSFHALQGDKLYDSQLADDPVTGTITTSWDGTIRMRTLVAK